MSCAISRGFAGPDANSSSVGSSSNSSCCGLAPSLPCASRSSSSCASPGHPEPLSATSSSERSLPPSSCASLHSASHLPMHLPPPESAAHDSAPHTPSFSAPLLRAQPRLSPPASPQQPPWQILKAQRTAIRIPASAAPPAQCSSPAAQRALSGGPLSPSPAGSPLGELDLEAKLRLLALQRAANEQRCAEFVALLERCERAAVAAAEPCSVSVTWGGSSANAGLWQMQPSGSILSPGAAPPSALDFPHSAPRLALTEQSPRPRHRPHLGKSNTAPRSSDGVRLVLSPSLQSLPAAPVGLAEQQPQSWPGVSLERDLLFYQQQAPAATAGRGSRRLRKARTSPPLRGQSTHSSPRQAAGGLPRRRRSLQVGSPLSPHPKGTAAGAADSPKWSSVPLLLSPASPKPPPGLKAASARMTRSSSAASERTARKGKDGKRMLSKLCSTQES